MIFDQPDEELDAIVTLQCRHCDKIDCKEASLYIPDDSKTGCTRRVSQLDADKFQHYTKEVIPFWKLSSEQYIQKSYEEIMSFLQQIYNAPIGTKLDERGKAVIEPARKAPLF